MIARCLLQIEKKGGGRFDVRFSDVVCVYVCVKVVFCICSSYCLFRVVLIVDESSSRGGKKVLQANRGWLARKDRDQKERNTVSKSRRV